MGLCRSVSHRQIRRLTGRGALRKHHLRKADAEMTSEPRRREVFSNPFFVVVLATSVLFVLTVLAYLVPYLVESVSVRVPRNERSAPFAVWVDRNAPRVLAAEFGVMLVAAVLAMATDPWFSARARSKRPGNVQGQSEVTSR
jgi:hypothetical protein